MRGERQPAGRLVSNWSRLLLLAVLLVAAFLRFYRLDAQSLWNDEGNSARIAERSIDLIVEGAAGDIHPPGYYLLLHFWRALFGQSELALRSLSVVAGLALVGCTYLLGSRLFDGATGLIGAFLAAISPFGVYYAQEARMYALLGALSALSTLLVSRLLHSTGSSRTPRFRALAPFIAYAAAGAAGLYTHYAFVFVLVAHNVLFAVWWLIECLRPQPRWRPLVGWAGAQAAVLVLYSPWLPRALAAAGWSSAGEGYRLGSALLDVFRVLTVGITLPLSEATMALVVVGALILVGLVPGPARKLAREQAGLPLWLGTGVPLITFLVPLALFFGLDLYKPAWLKFLIVILPPFYILVARGVERLGDLVPRTVRAKSPVLRFTLYAVILLVQTALAYPSLRNLYFNPAYFRDDYRQLAADIQAIRRPGDAVILNAPNQWEVFTYYTPDEDVYPAPYHPSEGRVQEFLTPILEEHERLFVLYWGDAESDPRKRIESWLAEHAYKAGDRWYGDVRLATYGVAPLPQQPSESLEVRFGAPVDEDGVMLLRGYALAQRGPFGPGDVVPVSLFWEVEDAVEESYKVTLQLLDDGGNLVAQIDTVPRDGLAPTTSWQEGQRLVDRYGLRLPGDLPPGRYTMIVAVYHAASGERLRVTVDGEEVGDHVVLSEITVEAW